jgi:hypothetical protein
MIPLKVSMTLPQYAANECGVDGEAVLLSPQQAELLALLLVSPPDRPCAYETIAAALWPDPDRLPLGWRKQVQVLVMALRDIGIAIERAGPSGTTGYLVPAAARGGPLARVSNHVRCPLCMRRLNHHLGRLAA